MRKVEIEMNERSFSVTDIEGILDSLFRRAKSIDEFEYICAFMSAAKGLYTRSRDTSSEVWALYRDALSFIQKPLSSETQIRIGLLIYCHMVEASTIYEILWNMLRSIKGERCIPDPLPSSNGKGKVVEGLVQEAKALGEQDLAEVITWMYNSSLRNAFEHSDYVLHDGMMCSVKGHFTLDGRKTNALKYGEVAEIIGRGVGFFNSLFNTINDHRKSYKADITLEPKAAAVFGIQRVKILANSTIGIYGIENLG